MNCPACRGAMEPGTLADSWHCPECGSDLMPCFACGSGSALRDGEVSRCLNSECPSAGAPFRRCGSCGAWSLDDLMPDSGLTRRCHNPACGTTEPREHREVPLSGLGTTEPRTAHPGSGPPPAHSGTATWEDAVDADGDHLDQLLDGIASQSHFEDRYELRGLLGGGGMGEVHRAFDKILQREVAIKMMAAHVGGAPEVRGQFLKEARVGGRLLHPNVLAVFDVGVNRDRRIYYTMRLVDGASLHSCLQGIEKGVATKFISFPLIRVVEALLGACQGVDYAHQNGVIHLDLKPQNILVSGFEEVFVIDWGLARVDDVDDTERLVDLYRGAAPTTHDQHTVAYGNRVVGTPAYMAPEQTEGRVGQFDARTDVYGLGGILYYILYNQPPNRGPTVDQMFLASRRPKVPGKLRQGILPRGERVRQKVLDAVEALAAICLKALDPDPSNRHADVEELIIELGEWAEALRT